MILEIYGLQQVMTTNIVIEQQPPYCTHQESLSVFFLPFSGVKEQTKLCSLYYDYGSSCGDTAIWILSVGDMTHGYKVGFNEATALPPAPDDRRVISLS